MQTMVRTEVRINGEGYLLAQGADLNELRRQMESASREGGRFVDFTVVGNRSVAVLVSPRTEVVIAEETVQFDARDTGDDEDPFGGFFDL
ncbi:hypothetical protein NQ166_14090 [Microbacterium sp. zg.Y1090]|uniref:hypothetical protein n=1 Tax=Microbacterium TaxID=33882 RepID=UPI00214B2141|nr:MULTISPECIES: hypothetical protein [unclassified Microbacterium]MCR2812277.1 hypothetical protein [Microbacterium sp. zg.Y1084]MCR2819961.1 hypothetical protein [Microbacterium sp. zg.Y1090]MDL5488193.1 hypothetical protein [Microbacterium sp. zg-Y1211]WIM29697.1 hypothetical protein QNO26_05280 [Microbacterium sp. zg-Y1090]